MQAKRFSITFAVSSLTAPCVADAFDISDVANATAFSLWYCDTHKVIQLVTLAVPIGGTVTVYAQEGERFTAGKPFAFISGSGSFTAIVTPRRV